MRYYVIINGVNSLTIEGLAIKTLPPISKPAMRNIREEIDGRDGDITTELGYGAYDRILEIGLYGAYDIDKIISFFNSKGTIIFSDEPDKYYNFEIVDRIDYTKLVKFRTAMINIHCQPFKYPVSEEPQVEEYQYVEATGTDITLENTSENIFNKFDLFGNTSQTGTPTPSSPIPVNVVSGDNTINICGKNSLDINAFVKGRINNTTGNIEYANNVSSMVIGENNISFIVSVAWNSGITSDFIPISTGNYVFKYGHNREITMAIDAYDSQKTKIARIDAFTQTQTPTTRTFTISDSNVKYIRIHFEVNTANVEYIVSEMQVEKGNATSYEPYTGNSYPIYLGVENLFDKNNANIINAGISSKVIGASDLNKLLYIRVQPNTTYTIQRRNDGNVNRFRAGSCSVVPAVDVSLPNAIENDNATSITITTGASDTYLAVMYYRTQETTLTEQQVLDSIIINKGSLPCHVSSLPIELCKIGTYQDYIYKDNGNWYLHKEIGKVVLNGSEDWLQQQQTGFYRYGSNVANATSDSSLSNTIISKSNYFNSISFNSRNTNTNETIYFVTNNSQHQFFINTQTYTTLETFKTWLSTHNTIVYYVLATPTNTEITDTTLIEQLEALKLATSYEGQTNISQENNDKPFILDVEAIKKLS